MIQLDSANIAAIIGVIGTIAGTIMGYLLNSLSRLGKVEIFQNSVDVSIFKETNLGGCEKQNDITSETSYITFEVNIDFYNSSERSRILRDIKFKTIHRGQIIKQAFTDETHHSNRSELRNINLRPKEIQNYKLLIYSVDSINELYHGDCYIEYRNDKNKLEQIKINKEDTIHKGIKERILDLFR